MWWTVAAVCAAAGVGLVAVAALGELEGADKIASVTGAVVALAGVPLTLLALRRSAGPAAPGGNVREVRVRAAEGGIAAAGSITAAGAAPGGGVVDGVDTREVRATGPGSIAAGGDIVGIDLSGRRS
ncbi:hypothetical protein ABT093_15000 [Kitasatospora sp. NPDC002551]|uniref:hypothetical protein n=1 Tax=Kitasatospora sp. NPDC002551 TaxID=3154539 RepID=UPI00332F92A4